MVFIGVDVYPKRSKLAPPIAAARRRFRRSIPSQAGPDAVGGGTGQVVAFPAPAPGAGYP